MSRKPLNAGRIIGILILCGFLATLVWSLTRPPKRPASRRITQAESQLEAIAENQSERKDAELVRQLLQENLDERRFSFPTVVIATADRKVLPLDMETASHKRVTAAINAVLESATVSLSRPGSPVRRLRRINEGSRFFEDALREGLDATDGMTCEIPTTREGDHQRSGYPDLKVVDEASGDVFYLDPKLVEQDSWDSSFRSFYFEPKNGTLKISDHAVHLLVGIAHDGRDGEWTFGPWRIVDLSKLEVRLKAEFQASNRELYGTADE